MKKFTIFTAAVIIIGLSASIALANHSWGNYHWARTANPFTLKLGDNVSLVWDSYLNTASNDWSQSLVLDTNVVPGLANPRTCRAVNGRAEICNSKYGNNGWLGMASIWVSGNHITKGAVRMNDTYFNTAKYNKPAWKNLVVCQEVGHIFGLDHQDEDFNNTNLGTCMDYTSDPDGSIKNQLSNEYPNAHDYEQLETIYSHLDSGNTILSKGLGAAAAALSINRQNLKMIEELDLANPQEWGEVIRKSKNGRSSLHERNLGRGEKIFTFVIWADEE